MTLISQEARKRWTGKVRGSGGGSYRRRKKRRRLRSAALTIIVIVGGFTVWRMWFSPDTGLSRSSAGQAVTIARDKPIAREKPIARNGRDALLASIPSTSVAAANKPSHRRAAITKDPKSAPRAERPTQQPASVMEMGAPSPGGMSLAKQTPVQTIAASSNAASKRTIASLSSPQLPAAALDGSATPVERLVVEAQALAAQNQPVQARAVYNSALHRPDASAADRHLIRQRMMGLNDMLLFSPGVYDGDPFAERYTIRPGDTLSVIAHRLDLNIDWRFLQRINRIADPRRIRVGQTIKVVHGPFHAIIDKSDFRLDLYAGDSSDLLYIRSFSVGLGENNQTPEGAWVVRAQSKLVNPHWINPRTGEAFSADNPDNPIGERWIGLKGQDSDTSTISGIGIHGTIEPDSIGKNASMGCVRLLPDDVAMVYELLVEGVSKVQIVP